MHTQNKLSTCGMSVLEAEIGGSNFRYANLASACLDGTDLESADLANADMSQLQHGANGAASTGTSRRWISWGTH